MKRISQYKKIIAMFCSSLMLFHISFMNASSSMGAYKVSAINSSQRSYNSEANIGAVAGVVAGVVAAVTAIAVGSYWAGYHIGKAMYNYANDTGDEKLAFEVIQVGLNNNFEKFDN